MSMKKIPTVLQKVSNNACIEHSGRRFDQTLDLPISKVSKIIQNFLQCYPHIKKEVQVFAIKINSKLIMRKIDFFFSCISVD